jgi:hypothetical protein
MSRNLYQQIESLPKSLQQQVLDFIIFITSGNKPSDKKKLKKKSPVFKWQGALKGKYKKTNSVELQHKLWQ